MTHIKPIKRCSSGHLQILLMAMELIRWAEVDTNEGVIVKDLDGECKGNSEEELDCQN